MLVPSHATIILLPEKVAAAAGGSRTRLMLRTQGKVRYLGVAHVELWSLRDYQTSMKDVWSLLLSEHSDLAALLSL